MTARAIKIIVPDYKIQRKDLLLYCTHSSSRRHGANPTNSGVTLFANSSGNFSAIASSISLPRYLALKCIRSTASFWNFPSLAAAASSSMCVCPKSRAPSGDTASSTNVHSHINSFARSASLATTSTSTSPSPPSVAVARRIHSADVSPVNATSGTSIVSVTLAPASLSALICAP